jgi:hypothetical protein
MPEYDNEALKMRRPRPTRAVKPYKKCHKRYVRKV